VRRAGGAAEGGGGGEGEEDCFKARGRGTPLSSILKTGSEAIRSGDGQLAALGI